ncbi:MAG TPA: extracellular solute-binding protein [Chloroflexota bacterium]|nr:extracellular solute-binding protein [Chloroflexota bacterium]
MSLSRNSRRRWSIAVTLLAGAAMVAGGSFWATAHAAPAHASVTITLWSGLSGPDQTGFKKIIDGFNSSQSSVVVNYDQNSFNGYGTKLATALSAGQAPNMWTLDAAGSATYMSQGQMTPLDSLIAKSKILSPSNFAKTNWNAYRYKGKQLMIPLDVVPLMMYYNKALLKKAGLKSPVVSGGLSKVVAAAKKMTKGSSQYGMVIPTDWPMQFMWPTMLAQFGGKAYDSKSNKSLVNSKAAVDALTTLRSLIYKYHLGPTQYAVDQDIKMLANGSAAQIFDGSWQITNPTLNTLGKNFGVSVVPQFGPRKAVFIGDTGFALYKKNSTAENKAAIKFIEYYETHSIDMARVGDVPVYQPVIKSAAFKKLGGVVQAAKELKYGVYNPPIPNYDDHWLYDDALWPVLRGQSSDIKGDLTKAANAITNHLQNGGG